MRMFSFKGGVCSNYGQVVRGYIRTCVCVGNSFLGLITNLEHTSYLELDILFGHKIRITSVLRETERILWPSSPLPDYYGLSLRLS